MQARLVSRNSEGTVKAKISWILSCLTWYIVIFLCNKVLIGVHSADGKLYQSAGTVFSLAQTTRTSETFPWTLHIYADVQRKKGLTSSVTLFFQNQNTKTREITPLRTNNSTRSQSNLITSTDKGAYKSTRCVCETLCHARVIQGQRFKVTTWNQLLISLLKNSFEPFWIAFFFFVSKTLNIH